ncbi:P-II family nitrogen regulator [Alkalihalobacillus sp. BA299]|uniref:P-II family nitrogen regulator n=1 Tax=Alkalihalobacillus sp. BA299 TaxID=2815938 RepID=UPI001ADBD51A|nr:P-II family nitrogen regulator [Alkalihalobacillus sp. BA299]
MKKIEAIIRPENFQKLREEIEKFGVKGLTVSEVGGCGVQKGKQGLFRGNTFEITLLPKVKVEIVTDVESVDSLVTIIKKTCTTGEVGDGKIFIYPIEEVIRIRTGQRGTEAIV